jgi:glutathione-specific gamma-glutamylcyclotransferase
MWVFGYGSLMWDGWEAKFGGTHFDGAELLGYRRSFNKKSVKNWGTADSPCPTLGLEPCEGGSCVGTAFEFAEDRRAAVEAELREREGPSFDLFQLAVLLPGGRQVCAAVPVNDKCARTYIGNMPVEDRARLARTAIGTSGRCADYVRNLHAKLSDLEVRDGEVEEFVRLMERG